MTDSFLPEIPGTKAILNSGMAMLLAISKGSVELKACIPPGYILHELSWRPTWPTQGSVELHIVFDRAKKGPRQFISLEQQLQSFRDDGLLLLLNQRDGVTPLLWIPSSKLPLGIAEEIAGFEEHKIIFRNLKL